MTTLVLSHKDCLAHDPPGGHPERPDRLRAVDEALSAGAFSALERRAAPLGDPALAAAVHSQGHIDRIQAATPGEGSVAKLDPDTYMSAGSWDAARRALGAAIEAVDQVMTGQAANAFCAVRPPGHHAEKETAMGFCLINNAAAAAFHARNAHGAERVAVIDFDVHHGNGTQDIFWSDRDMFYGSTHQMPLDPGSGHKTETGAGNIFNAPLNAGDGGARFREAMEAVILPALDRFQPDLVVISAGFDAHRDDPLAMLNLVESDYEWVTQRLMEIARRHGGGRIVSVLEGGYDLRALARSTSAHVASLMNH